LDYAVVFQSINTREENDIADDEVRHVGFTSDIEEFSERVGMLQRRDTPHHLKNKRISSTLVTPTTVDSAEKVRLILAQVAGRQSSSGSVTAAATPSSVTASSDKRTTEVIINSLDYHT